MNGEDLDPSVTQVLVTQSCLTLCNPMACSPPGSSVHEIFQARYWSGLPFPSPGDLPNPGIEPGSHCRQILYGLSYKGSPSTPLVNPAHTRALRMSWALA